MGKGEKGNVFVGRVAAAEECPSQGRSPVKGGGIVLEGPEMDTPPRGNRPGPRNRFVEQRLNRANYPQSFTAVLPLLVLPLLVANQLLPHESHPLHLSHANMVLEGRHAIINVRLFQDDLELAMDRYHGIDALRVRPDPIVDSLFTDYFNSKFTLTIADSIHHGRVVASGQAEDMWWYAVMFEASEEISRVTFRNDLLFDIFDDQRNITRVLHTSSEKQRTFYAVASDPETHVFSAN